MLHYNSSGSGIREKFDPLVLVRLSDRWQPLAAKFDSLDVSGG